MKYLYNTPQIYNKDFEIKNKKMFIFHKRFLFIDYKHIF